MDTHTLVLFAWDMPELPARVKTLLEDPETVPQVSIASFWEIGIKASLGKWDLSGDVLVRSCRIRPGTHRCQGSREGRRGQAFGHCEKER